MASNNSIGVLTLNVFIFKDVITDPVNGIASLRSNRKIQKTENINQNKDMSAFMFHFPSKPRTPHIQISLF